MLAPTRLWWLGWAKLCWLCSIRCYWNRGLFIWWALSRHGRLEVWPALRVSSGLLCWMFSRREQWRGHNVWTRRSGLGRCWFILTLLVVVFIVFVDVVVWPPGDMSFVRFLLLVRVLVRRPPTGRLLDPLRTRHRETNYCRSTTQSMRNRDVQAHSTPNSIGLSCLTLWRLHCLSLRWPSKTQPGCNIRATCGRRACEPRGCQPEPVASNLASLS